MVNGITGYLLLWGGPRKPWPAVRSLFPLVARLADASISWIQEGKDRVAAALVYGFPLQVLRFAIRILQCS